MEKYESMRKRLDAGEYCRAEHRARQMDPERWAEAWHKFGRDLLVAYGYSENDQIAVRWYWFCWDHGHRFGPWVVLEWWDDIEELRLLESGERTEKIEQEG